MLFKNGTYNTIFTRQISGSHVDHHNCRLGQWYEGDAGKIHFGRFDSYQKMLKPHQEVHTIVGEIRDTIKDMEHLGDNRDVIIDKFSRMENASSELFIHLDSMLNESAAK
ncbi:CZB domain-containing protein [Sulfuricurvum sp.]|uniref:CZB domain-containing protein n=1 Tax=Sulfuricurvum sp. TaxID=2025608 RepID=UPI002E351ED5|nr:CZB domain-containing protein [Sulfuricurvum sp.]HEX5329768.1 CZB domain-containing protein [Sulfuricurvum sp.]